MRFIVGWAKALNWWQMTRMLAWGAAGLALLAALLAVTFAEHVGSYTILAIPAGLFLAGILLPAILVALVFLHADRQDVVDREADFMKR